MRNKGTWCQSIHLCFLHMVNPALFLLSSSSSFFGVIVVYVFLRPLLSVLSLCLSLSLSLFLSPSVARRIHAVGIKCPQPVALRMHVIVMEFFGVDGWPSPKLKDASFSGL